MSLASDASLRGKSKAIAKAHGLSSQEVTQMYLFERFLTRLERSDYREHFILKGGLMVASLVGIAQRTTMDMDATLKAIPLEEDAVTNIVRGICAVETNDDVSF